MLDFLSVAPKHSWLRGPSPLIPLRQAKNNFLNYIWEINNAFCSLCFPFGSRAGIIGLTLSCFDVVSSFSQLNGVTAVVLVTICLGEDGDDDDDVEVGGDNVIRYLLFAGSVVESLWSNEWSPESIGNIANLGVGTGKHGTQVGTLPLPLVCVVLLYEGWTAATTSGAGLCIES